MKIRARISSPRQAAMRLRAAAAAGPGIVHPTVVHCMLCQCEDMANILALRKDQTGRGTQVETVVPKTWLSLIEILKGLRRTWSVLIPKGNFLTAVPELLAVALCRIRHY